MSNKKKNWKSNKIEQIYLLEKYEKKIDKVDNLKAQAALDSIESNFK